MGMEYSAGRTKRNIQRNRKAARAIPAAGPVTVTKADGSVEVQPAIQKGVDRRTAQPWTSSQIRHMTDQNKISRSRGT